MSARKEVITPKKATQWLSQNKGNRNLSQSLIDRIAGDILAGAWEVNGATIVFNDDQLLDGQNRLAAIVKADQSVESYVVRGVASSARATMDEGKIRTGGDVLKMNGFMYANSISSAATTLIKAKEDEEFGPRAIRGSRKVSNSRLLDFAAPRKEELEAVASLLHAFKLVPLSQMIAIFYCADLVDPKVAEDFRNELVGGAAEDPYVLHLREKILIPAHRAPKSSSRYMYSGVKAMQVIRAWNAYLIEKEEVGMGKYFRNTSAIMDGLRTEDI